MTRQRSEKRRRPSTYDPRRARWVVLAAITLASVAQPVAGQDAPERANDGRLSGVIVDLVGERPIANALVVLGNNYRAVLTDSLGRFDLGELTSGDFELTVRRYGYQTQGVTGFLPAGSELDIEVPLPPTAVLIDGLSVVTERLQTMEERMERRRRSTPMTVHAVGQDRLVQSSARDVVELLDREATLQIQTCGRNAFADQCIRRRGRLVEPRVYVDEMPVIGGLGQLASYQPYDLYLVEVFGRGLEVRAYTHQFMERMARKPVALLPVRIW
ncbi:MAG: carboxypeptidase regulatory-like domain-containing protein [Gemmatimonadota bacterium]